MMLPIAHRRRSSGPMSQFVAAIASVLLATLAGCTAEQRERMEAEKLDSFELTSEQRTIAEAFVAGFKAEMHLPLLRSRDYAKAACYAKRVEMPSWHARAHLLYLEHYVEADRDFYGFFQRHGIDEKTAWEMSERYRAAFDACSLW